MSSKAKKASSKRKRRTSSTPNFRVTLHVQPGKSNGWDGYTDTTSDTNLPYCYRFSGGNKGDGNVSMMHSPQGPDGLVQVAIGQDSGGGVARYKIAGIGFNGPGKSQFSWKHGGQTHVAVITDKNIANATVKYSVEVLDVNRNCVIPCDPMIKNVPTVF